MANSLSFRVLRLAGFEALVVESLPSPATAELAEMTAPEVNAFVAEHAREIRDCTLTADMFDR